MTGRPKTGGRKRGAKNKRTVALERAQAETAVKITDALGAQAFSGDAHAFLVGIYKDPAQPIEATDDQATGFYIHTLAKCSSPSTADSCTGLQAIDYIDRGEGPADSWKTEQLAMIQRAEKPTSAQLLLMVASPVQKLVEASSGGACQSAK